MGQIDKSTLAILVRGGIGAAYENDISFVYNTLRELGVPKGQIIVIDSRFDEPGENDFDGDGIVSFNEACNFAGRYTGVKCFGKID